MLRKFLLSTAFVTLLGCVTSSLQAQDPNFHIFLCFGQSNMEGAARPEHVDSTNVEPGLQVLSAVDFADGSRVKGQWYKALPPLCRQGNGLSPADYFGREYLANLPQGHRVGLINVAIGGCKIQAFIKDLQEDYAANVAPVWMKSALKAYNNRPYDTLLEMARKAQQDGVIEGILMHQGESNVNEPEWPAMVKQVYESLLSDLGLKAEDVPLIVGEVVNADRGGISADCNNSIDTLSRVIPTAHAISSSTLTNLPDHLHFNAEGYREFGRRYARAMLKIKGIEPKVATNPYNNSLVSPLIHEPSMMRMGPRTNGKKVTFNFKAPNAKEVELSGQFLAKPVQMTRNMDGVWSTTVSIEKPDIYPYNFVIDGISVSDPLNPQVFPNENFKSSLLEVQSDDALTTVWNVKHGKVSYNTYYSEVLGANRPLLVYTPAGYEESMESLPVFYLISGTTDTEETWFKVGKLNVILDNLIASGNAKPMIVVMPYGNMGSTPMPSSLDAATMYKVFARELTECIMPYVESNYRTIQDRTGRAIAGFSRGGGQTLFTAFSNLDKFAWVASYSAYLTPAVMEKYFPNLLGSPSPLNSELSLLWFGVGSSDFLYPDVVRNRELFDARGIKHEDLTTEGAHTWMNARTYLATTLQKFFK